MYCKVTKQIRTYQHGLLQWITPYQEHVNVAFLLNRQWEGQVAERVKRDRHLKCQFAQLHYMKTGVTMALHWGKWNYKFDV